MDANNPETISYWSLDLRVRDPHPGTNVTVNARNVNDLIRLDMVRWEWIVPRLYDLSPKQSSGEAVVPVLATGPQTTPVTLLPAGPGDITVRGERIVFRNSALTATVDQGEADRVLTAPVDGTENVSLVATVAAIDGAAGGAAAARRANDATQLPLAAHQPFETRSAPLRLSEFRRVQPIFYLEQHEGFVLLAEGFQDNGERRLIYTLQAVTAEAAEAGRVGAIPPSQVRATTPAFNLADGRALHTIRAHQDGNLRFGGRGSYGGYLEFWVNGLPLGIRRLPDARFRFRGGPASLFIGGWPQPGGEALYLTGEIIHLNFDPINKCIPC